MPYIIKKVKGGYKVTDEKKFFSNKPLTKEMATKQRIAMSIPLSKKTGKPMASFWA